MKHLITTGLLISLPIAGAAQEASDEDKGYLTNLIEENLSGDERVINIQGFQGALSSQATITQLTVADSEGVWLTLDNVTLIWNRSALLRGAIDVDELSAEKITVSRAPLPSDFEAPAAEATPFSLPDLPVSIALDQLAIDRVELGESFLGEPLAFQIEGAAGLAGGEGSANITAQRLDGQTGRFAIAGEFVNETRALTLDLDLTEGPGGIIAQLIDLPGQPDLDLTLQGAGPLSDFSATLALATEGAPRVEGDFTLTTAETGQSQFGLDVGGNIAPLLAPDYQDFFGPDVTLVAQGTQSEQGGFDLTTLDLRADKLRLTGAAAISPGGWPKALSLSGSIASDNGEIVLLPLAGPKTFVDRVNLNIGYDQSVSDDWTAAFDVAGFDRPGLLIRDIGLEGGGKIIAGTGAAVGEVTADLNYRATGVELDDAGAAQAFGDAVTGALSMAYQEGAPTEITRLTLTGPGIEVMADATIATPDENLRTQANVILSAEALSRFATLAGQPGLAGAADLTVLTTISPLDGQYNVLMTGQTTDLAIGIAQLDPVLAGAGTVSLQAVRDTEGTRLDALRIATPEAVVTASATLTSAESAAEFNVALKELAIIEPDLSGPAQLTGTATRNTQGVIEFDVNGTGPAATLAANGTVNPAETGQTVNAAVTAAVRDLSRYSAISGQALGGAAQIRAQGVLLSDGMRFDADIAAQTTDLQTGIAELDPLLAGAGTVSASVARTGADQFRLRDLMVNTPALDLAADATGGVTGPADATLDLTINDAGQVAQGMTGPMTLNVDAARDNAGVIAANLVALGQGTDVRLDATATPQGTQYQLAGTLDADLADLAPFAQLAGRPLAGAVSADITGTAMSDFTSFDADLTIGTRALAIGDARFDPILTGDGVLTGTARRADGGDAMADLSARLGETRVDVNAVATPQGDAFAVDGTLDARLSDLSRFRGLAGLPLSGGVSANVSGQIVTDLSGIDAQIAVETSSPAIGNPMVDQLLRGSGTLRAEVRRTQNGFAVRNFAAQTPALRANANIDARDDGTGTAQFDAGLTDIGPLTGGSLTGPATASGTANRISGAWGIDIEATGPGGIGAQVGGQIADSGNLNVTVNGTAPLGLANSFIEPRRVDGDVQFDIAVNGPPALSSVSGRISTAGTRATAPTLGLALENITGGVTLAGASAQVGIEGNVGSGGRIAINGPVTLAAPFNGNLAIDLASVVLEDPNLYRTTVDGTIGLNGPLTGGARITGTLNIGQTDVQVPSSGIGALGDLPDVTHVGANAGVRTTLERAGATTNGNADASAAPAGPGFPLDITVNAPNRIFIRGRGLDAELGGTLNIGGTSNAVVPIGQFELVRGRLDILQQRFDLTEGQATLQGDFLPYLRLVAATETRTGTLVRIIVEGPANAPEVTFQSTPDLPQDEVLSQLIFGRNISEISPLQAVQLAAAVGTLAGRGGGGLIDNFRANIGLDDFDVTTDAEGNAAVRAGKYLTENVYTDVTINSEGETEINLNLDITSEITAKGTAKADGETSIGIFFERDY